MNSRIRSFVAVIVAGFAFPVSASAGIVYQFAPTNPKAGTKFIGIRAIQTPPGYTGVQLPDSSRVVDLYLVRHAYAPSVHSASDPRLIPLGRFDPFASTIVKLPKLDTATYAMVARCLNCKGRTFYVFAVGSRMSGPAGLMLLHASASPSFPIWPIVIAVAFALAVAAWALARGWRTRRRDATLRAAAAVRA